MPSAYGVHNMLWQLRMVSMTCCRNCSQRQMRVFGYSALHIASLDSRHILVS